MFAWTPLIDASAFTGITTDVLAAGAGIISVAVIILGIFYVVNAMKG